jgi:hypothetical protein
MLSEPRSLEQALADLIERRDHDEVMPNKRARLDRMIAGLEAEIRWRRMGRSKRHKLVIVAG